MYIRDIMTTNVVTIPSNTSIINAKRIMDSRRFRRLPVVDKGKLVGIVTADSLEKAAPAETDSRSMWELTYSLASLYKTQIKSIMKKNIVTVTPDMTAEEALALAQSKKVGALVVVENGRVVGIVTTNDLFYKIVNPLLGLGQPGNRIEITGGGEGKALEEIISTINRLGLEITTLHIEYLPETIQKNVCVHINNEDTSQLVAVLQEKGYSVKVRPR